jgi:hypothetical protein
MNFGIDADDTDQRNNINQADLALRNELQVTAALTCPREEKRVVAGLDWTGGVHPRCLFCRGSGLHPMDEASERGIRQSGLPQP